MTAEPTGLRKWSEMYSEAYSSDCPVRQALDRLGGKWTTLIIGMLEDGPKRFSELRRGIHGISQKMLTQTLRSLERDGLIKRTLYPEVPPRVEYELTPLGETLCEPIAAIIRWTEAHIDEVTAAQVRYDAAETSGVVAVVQPEA
ncbi:MAG: helix-turn-helix domain-containing protein [bacterium]|nr:helix-turn-helix domain-containing protein [bacterium]